MIEIKLTKEEHDFLFPHMKKNIWNTCKYYYFKDKNKIYLELKANAISKIFYTLAYPFFVLREGFGDIKQINKEWKDMYKNEEMYSDTIFINNYNEEKREKVMNIVESKLK